jgi:hypothetical protein
MRKIFPACASAEAKSQEHSADSQTSNFFFMDFLPTIAYCLLFT